MTFKTSFNRGKNKVEFYEFRGVVLSDERVSSINATGGTKYTVASATTHHDNYLWVKSETGKEKKFQLSGVKSISARPGHEVSICSVSYKGRQLNYELVNHTTLTTQTVKGTHEILQVLSIAKYTGKALLYTAIAVFGVLPLLGFFDVHLPSDFVGTLFSTVGLYWVLTFAYKSWLIGSVTNSVNAARIKLKEMVTGNV